MILQCVCPEHLPRRDTLAAWSRRQAAHRLPRRSAALERGRVRALRRGTQDLYLRRVGSVVVLHEGVAFMEHENPDARRRHSRRGEVVPLLAEQKRAAEIKVPSRCWPCKLLSL